MESKNEPQSLWAITGRYSGLGLQWAASVVFFMAVGWWLDGKLGVRPLLTILGAFLGGAAGFYSLYQNLVVAARGEDEEDGEL